MILKYNEYYFIKDIYQLKENYRYFPKAEKAVSSVIHKKRYEEIWLHYARLWLLLF